MNTHNTTDNNKSDKEIARIIRKNIQFTQIYIEKYEIVYNTILKEQKGETHKANQNCIFFRRIMCSIHQDSEVSNNKTPNLHLVITRNTFWKFYYEN